MTSGVFDVMMPKKDGFTLAQEVRAANAEIPIIFLTAKTLKDDILEGFKIGADDYITKPFSMEELTFRIEAILRRVRGKKNKESNMYKIGKIYLRHPEANPFHAREADQAHHQGVRAAEPALCPRQRNPSARLCPEDPSG